jgi:hypothetical protein
VWCADNCCCGDPLSVQAFTQANDGDGNTTTTGTRDSDHSSDIESRKLESTIVGRSSAPASPSTPHHRSHNSSGRFGSHSKLRSASIDPDPIVARESLALPLPLPETTPAVTVAASDVLIEMQATQPTQSLAIEPGLPVVDLPILSSEPHADILVNSPQ